MKIRIQNSIPKLQQGRSKSVFLTRPWCNTMILLAAANAAWADPVSVCPSNPHYFFYKGKPLVLITSVVCVLVLVSSGKVLKSSYIKEVDR